MQFFKNIFSKKASYSPPDVLVDMHSHFLPGIDDGAKDVETSIRLINQFIDMGYKKLICTPHIMGDFYKNDSDTISAALHSLPESIKEKISIEFAAEYYLDEHFIGLLHANQPLLCFGKEKYVLFETSYINESAYLSEAIFLLKSNGYTPVLAHPERYTYMYNDYKKYQQLSEHVLFQLNTVSITGYYSGMAKKISERLITDDLISFVSSDCHSQKHIYALHKAVETDWYKKVCSSDKLRNNQLLG